MVEDENGNIVRRPDVHLPSVPHRALRSQVVSSADMNSDLAMTTDNEAWANNPIYGSKYRLKWGKNLSTRMMVQETPILTTIEKDGGFLDHHLG